MRDMLRNTKLFRRLTALALALVISLTAAAFMQNTQVYAADFLVQDFSDMLEYDGYIYYIRSMTKGISQTIYRVKVDSGKTTKVKTVDTGIAGMLISDGTLFYATVTEKEAETYCCKPDGGDEEWFCDGQVVYVGSGRAYAIKKIGEKERLFYKDLATNKSTSVKTTSKTQTISYVKTIGDHSYYYLYDRHAKKLVLYSLKDGQKRLVKVATEKNNASNEDYPLEVSDVALIRGELYYDYGCYAGTANYWYGSIKKIVAPGQKKVISRNVGNETIVAGSRELYYNDSVGDKYYKYNFATGKNSVYSLTRQKGVDYVILGDKTYMADTNDKSTIKISRFSSGTDRQTLTRNVITIPYRQKSSINYHVSMKQVGAYNLVCVSAVDYSDAAYGWKGRVESIKWYVTDGAGKILCSFS